MDDKKKYRRSVVAIACYVLAAAMFVYICFTAGSTVNQINEYYAQYGMEAKKNRRITPAVSCGFKPSPG